MKYRYLSCPSLTLEYAELAMAGDDAITLYAYNISKKCPWKYSFDYHREVTCKIAHEFAEALIWC